MSFKGEKGIYLFDREFLAFTFKDKETPKGLYRLPFAITLPSRIPGSFNYNSKESDCIKIKYSVEVFFEDIRNVIGCKKEFIVREFFFTEEEIMEDWKKYEKILDLKKVLRNQAIRVQKEQDDNPK